MPHFRALPILLTAPLWAALAGAAVAQAPSPFQMAPAPGSVDKATVQLSAVFAGEQRPVRSGLVWRLYEERADGPQPLLLEKSPAAAPSFSLKPGNYVVHAAYGFAGASRRIGVQGGPVVERLTISAGALKVGGAIGDSPIQNNRLAVSVYVPIGSNSEGRLVAGNVRGGELVRLPEGP